MTLTLQDDAPDEGRAFFDWLAYEASVGPEVERLAIQRADALVASDSAQREYSDALGDSENKLHGTSHQRLNDQTMQTGKQFRETANNLFETLDGCLSQGGNREKYARVALRRQGLRVKRMRSNRFVGRSRGVVPGRGDIHAADEWTTWCEGGSLSGLTLLPIKQDTTT